MSPNVTQCSKLIWWSGNKFSHLIQCINMHFGRIFIQFSIKPI